MTRSARRAILSDDPPRFYRRFTVWLSRLVFGRNLYIASHKARLRIEEFLAVGRYCGAGIRKTHIPSVYKVDINDHAEVSVLFLRIGVGAGLIRVETSGDDIILCSEKFPGKYCCEFRLIIDFGDGRPATTKAIFSSRCRGIDPLRIDFIRKKERST